MNRPDKLDFKKVIADIEAAGITTHKLALMMSRQYTQIKRWKNGSEPRYYEGQMLLLILDSVSRETLQASLSQQHNSIPQA